MCHYCPMRDSNVQELGRVDECAPLTEEDQQCAHEGYFKNCARMYDLDHPGCKGALEMWARDTPCDDVLPQMIADYYDEMLAADEYTYEKDRAGQVLDRYVYTMCEQCCDCIPCGEATDTAVPKIADEDLSEFIEVRRHNCPLHWKADVCALYPDIEYRGPVPPTVFDAANPDAESPPVGDACVTGEDGACIAPVRVCDLTDKYPGKDPQAKQGRINRLFDAGLEEALEYYMDAWGCSAPSVWKSCHRMEFLMGRQDPTHANC